jgi:hypothetical protein
MESTLEELLNLLDDESPEKETSSIEVFESKIGKFLKDEKIAAGPDRIDNYVIYYTYCNSGGKLSKIEFFRQFNKEFSDYRFRTGIRRGFSLDGASFDLTREGLIEAKFHNKGKR